MILEGGYGNEAFRNRLEKGAPGWNPGLSGRSAGRGVGGRGWRSSDPALFPPCREMVSEGGGEGRRFHHYPVVVKLAGDNGGRQGARGIHGAAGVVDLQGKARVRERREMTRTVQGSLRPSAALDLSLRGVPVMGS